MNIHKYLATGMPDDAQKDGLTVGLTACMEPRSYAQLHPVELMQMRETLAEVDSKDLPTVSSCKVPKYCATVLSTYECTLPKQSPEGEEKAIACYYT